MNPTPSSEPPAIPAAPAPVVQGDATGGIIPYKNPPALTAYYLGVFSIIPCIGFFLGVGAVILGISGLRKRKKHPVIKGAVHAWFGIIAGGLSVLVHLFLVAMMVIGVMSRR